MPDRYDQSQAYAANNDFVIYIRHIATGYSTVFKAFLTSFEDAFVCDWKDTNVFGRMDPISTYQGTRRQINFGFDVVAYDVNEAAENFNNSRAFVQMLYPVYQSVGSGKFSATSMQAPPLLQIRFANLITSGMGGGPGIQSGLVGKLGGLSYAPNMDAGFFTGNSPDNLRAFGANLVTGPQIIPKVNQFSCNFTVLHTEELGFDRDTGNFRGAQNGFPYPSTPFPGHYNYGTGVGSLPLAEGSTPSAGQAAASSPNYSAPPPRDPHEANPENGDARLNLIPDDRAGNNPEDPVGTQLRINQHNILT